MSDTSTIQVEIFYDAVNKEYRARVDKTKAPAKRLGFVSWDFTRTNDFPSNAAVILQFVHQGKPPKKSMNGPMTDAPKTKGRYVTTGRFIECTVDKFTEKKGYDYTLSYDDNGTEKLLLDPELIIDGDAFRLTKFLRSVESEFRKLQQRHRAMERAASKGKKTKAKKARKR